MNTSKLINTRASFGRNCSRRGAAVQASNAAKMNHLRTQGLRSPLILGSSPNLSANVAYNSRPRFSSIRAHSHDTDDYERSMDGYDSDDYEDMNINTSRASSQSQQQGGYADLSFDHATAQPSNNGKRRKTTQAISSGFNIFLLFGAAIDRCVSRAQAAMLAACAASLSVLHRIARSGANRVNQTKLKAQKSFMKSSAGQKIDQWRRGINEIQEELPDDTWGKLMWLWDRPPVQRLRLTVSMFNLSFRLPALMALVATQVGLLASQVSLPMLAPLLLGTGMLLRSIKTNASFLFPRIGLLVVMLWMLWFANSVVQNTVAYLRKQGALDNRLAGGIITVSEVSALLVALVVLLSMLGVNVSALLLPAGIAVAIAAKDLSHNFLAGFFLFVVQPFKLGDRIAVSSSAPGVAPGSGLYGPMMGSGSTTPGWFEGVCERVDLRYTVVRQGRKKLIIPNSAFLTREFMIVEEGDTMPLPSQQHMNTTTTNGSGSGTTLGGAAQQSTNMNTTEQQQQQVQYVPFLTNDHRHVWQYVQGPPLHQELATAYPMQQPVAQQQPVTNNGNNSVDDDEDSNRNDDNNDDSGGSNGALSSTINGSNGNTAAATVPVSSSSPSTTNNTINTNASSAAAYQPTTTYNFYTTTTHPNNTTTTTNTTNTTSNTTNNTNTTMTGGYWTQSPPPHTTTYSPMTMGYPTNQPGSIPMNQYPPHMMYNTVQQQYYSHGSGVQSHPLSPTAWQQSNEQPNTTQQ